MATYEPPTSNLAIFDPSVFETNEEPLTIEEAKKRFLTYPVAQGAETLLDTTVVGSLTLNQSLAKIKLTGGTSATKSLVINNNDKIVVANPNNVVIGVGTCDSLTSNDSVAYSTIIGSNALSTTTSSGVGVANQITAIGYQALKNLGIGDTQTISNNIAIGSNSLVYFTGQSGVTSTANTAVGTQSGANDTHKLIRGTRNSFLGFNTGVSSALSGTCNQSTAIGADAIITESNQIQLGTETTYVNIPNYIKFADGTIQSTALSQIYGSLPNIFINSSQSNTFLSFGQMNSNLFYTSTNSNSPTVTIPHASINQGLLNATSINIYNTGTQINPIIIKGAPTGDPQRIFAGKYGNSTSSLPVPANSWVAIRGNSTQNNWWVVDRGNICPIEYNPQSTALDLIAVPLTNTLIRINPTANISAYIPDFDLVNNNQGQYFTIENINNTNSIDLRIVSDGAYSPSVMAVFTGIYGNTSNVLTIPPNSSYTIYISLNNFDFDVINRTPNIQTYNFPSATTIDYSNAQYFDTILNITGSTTSTIFLPDPKKTMNVNSPNRIITINNNGSALVSLGTIDASIFLGRYGNRSSAILLPDNSSYTLTCTGTNWEISGRSPNVVYRNIGLGATANYTNNFNFLDSSLYLSSTELCNITWLNAVSVNSHLTTTKIYNSGAFQITLNATITTNGTFIGKYGSGTSALILPANTWVELFSDGTNWLVNDRSVENHIYYLTTATANFASIASNFQYINAELHLTSSHTTSTTIVIPNTTDTLAKNQKYVIYNDNSTSTSSNAYNIILSSASVFRGAFLANNGTTYTLPPNTKVEFYNNGTNWVISDLGISGHQSIPIITTYNAQYDLTRPLRKYTIINKTDGLNANPVSTISLPAPLQSDVGQEIVVRLGIRSTFNFAQTGATAITFVASISQPLFLTGILNSDSIIIANFTTNLSSVRLTVLQYGYAGSGQITLTATINSVSIALTSGQLGAVHPLLVDIAGTPTTLYINQFQNNITSRLSTATGGSGSYSMMANATVTGTFNFTCSDYFAWTIC